MRSEAEEKNKALVRKYFEEVWNKGNVAAVDEFAALEFVDHDLLPGQGSSREEYKRSVTEFHAAFSHTGFTIEVQVVQGDKVITTFSMTTTHRGNFLGALPSGVVGTYSGIHRIVGTRSQRSGARATCWVCCFPGDFLLRELYTFTGDGWEQEDDISLLTIRRSATRS